MDGRLLDLVGLNLRGECKPLASLAPGHNGDPVLGSPMVFSLLESYGSRTMNPIGMVTNAKCAELARGTIMTLPPIHLSRGRPAPPGPNQIRAGTSWLGVDREVTYSISKNPNCASPSP
jgi:hypothetical protein